MGKYYRPRRYWKTGYWGICEWCGDDFYRDGPLNKHKHPHRFCSRHCWVQDKRKDGEGYLDEQGYIQVWKGPRRTRQHRRVFEEAIHRNLTSEEVVHHIDGDGANNSLDNLWMFESSAKHMAFHRGTGSRGLWAGEAGG